jgi:hypothetical protein
MCSRAGIAVRYLNLRTESSRDRARVVGSIRRSLTRRGATTRAACIALPECRLFAIEYHLPEAHAIGSRKGRLFKAPDADDLAKLAEAKEQLCCLHPQFVPEDIIPNGDETERLHRWG